MVSDLQWTTLPLADLADEITVGHVGPMVNEYLDSGIPFLRSQNVVPFNIDLTDIKYISRAFNERLRKSALAPGDVVIVRTGKPGTCAVIPNSLPLANCSDLVIVRPSERLDSRFLMYFVNSVAKDHVAAHLVGAVQQHFNVGSARTIQIPLPPLAEQRAIAHILGTLDDKIELNRKMNETLEAMARALFKSWFVDFDPVRKKKAGQATGLPPEIDALFPGEFENSALGEIPKGWRVGGLGENLTLLKDGSHNPPKRVESGIRFIAGATDLKRFSISFSKCTYITEADYAAMHRSWHLQAGDVLMTIVGTVGNVGIVFQQDLPFSLQRSIAILRPNDAVSTSFLYCLLLSDRFQGDVRARVNPTGQPGIYLGTLAAIPVCTPGQALISKFDLTAAPIFNGMKRTIEESRTLAAIRDTLLPKLISGELRVKDAERFVGGHSR